MKLFFSILLFFILLIPCIVKADVIAPISPFEVITSTLINFVLPLVIIGIFISLIAFVIILLINKKKKNKDLKK